MTGGQFARAKAAGLRVFLLWPYFCLVLLLAIAGCTQQPPQFVANEMLLAEIEIVPPHRQQIERVLVELFGTPDEPHVPDEIGLDIELLRMAAGPVGYAKRADGEKYAQQGLYRQHCATCHGVTGDGYGPAASMLEPYPRDFRPGVFKWKSTYLAAKPTDADVYRLLERGVPGTAMPSFALLSDKQLDSLAEYVKYLAMRGQVERELIAAVGDEFDFDPLKNTTEDALDPEIDEADRQLIDRVVENVSATWREAEERVVKPQVQYAPTEGRTAKQLSESVEFGRQLFLSDKAKCTECHDQASGQVAVKDLDLWNQAVADFSRSTAALAANIQRRESQAVNLSPAQQEQAAKRLAAQHRWLKQRQRISAKLLDPQPAYSRSLDRESFRGGDEPVDLFRRLHQGVAGSPMPGQGGVRPGVAGALTETEMWRLVDYLQQRAEQLE